VFIRDKVFGFLRVSADMGLGFNFGDLWHFRRFWQFSTVPTKILLQPSGSAIQQEA
jgi:hypothetical protein